MKATNAYPFMSPPLAEAVSTEADLDSSTPDGEEMAARTKWQQVIDDHLIEWGRAPLQLEDEGIDPPQRPTILLAIRIAKKLQMAGEAAPDAVVPDPNGGIVFQRRAGDLLEVIHIWDEENTEYRCYRGSKLVERQTS